VQTIGRPIYRCGEPGRTSANDNEIVERKFRFGFESQLVRDLSGGRLAQKGAVRKYDDRQ